jgi:phosphatidylserine/phosphatidylglycerophosphate/cardiolipin synthase-like enzyme
MGAAMRQRADAGVDVSGVFEKTGSSTAYSELGSMFCAGLRVRRDENPSFLHHKVIIIDDRIVITGSLNFSDNANDSNDENVLVIDNADIAALYIQEFNRIWDFASVPEPEKFPCN